MNCKHCECYLNDYELPFHIDNETWCPQCFVWVKSPEDTKFRAIECTRCHVISVDCGLGVCGQCNGRVAIVLPQKHVVSN